jgi:hypothetical protein
MAQLPVQDEAVVMAAHSSMTEFAVSHDAA